MPNKNPSVMFSSSFADRVEVEELSVVGELAERILRENGGKLEDAKGPLIEASRGGKHIELRVRAITFRQKDGNPNKNFVRFKSTKLDAIASSFAGKPFLLNHDKWDQHARMGTIEASEAVPLAGGWTGFRQTIRVVKPHAVQSVLDGTLDMFSIGWSPSGDIVCTAHGTSLRDWKKSCYRLEGCYPGKAVTVDGETKIAEYEYQSAEGSETSGVNTPAVSGTKIEDIRSALAAELSLPQLETKDESPMARFPLILAALSLPATGGAAELTEADDGRLSELITEKLGELKAATDERDQAIKRAELAEVEAKELKAKISELSVGAIDSVLETKGYKAGKLIRGKDAEGKSTPSARELRLRRIAKEDGIEALEAELAEMPKVSPVGADPELAAGDPNPRATGGKIPDSVLASTAKQLGISVEELTAHNNKLSGEN